MKTNSGDILKNHTISCEQTEEPVLVTIKCMVYNHGNYIRQCLDGFVMQQTTFRFQAIVHDDASTDNSADIIREYAEKYPDIIIPVIETENQYSKPDGSLRRFTYKYCLNSKYLAICEGDDYWTDPLKLQKQIDYLEAHPDVTLSCTRYQVLNQKTGETFVQPHDFFDYNDSSDETFEFTRDDAFTKRWMTSQLTMVLRTDAFKPDFFEKYNTNLDLYIIYCVLTYGKGVCHKFIGGVYRMHGGGVYAGNDEVGKLKFNYTRYCKLYKDVNDSILKYRIKLNYVKLLQAGVVMKPKNIFTIQVLCDYYFTLARKAIVSRIDALRVRLALRTKLIRRLKK